MKTTVLSFLFLFFSFNLFAQSHQLSIEVTDLRVSYGTIQACLFNQADAFPDEKRAYKFALVEVSENKARLYFKDLPAGDYAVALFHDENGDNLCNMNFFGIPKEGYGFSRNYVPTVRAPRFEETQFSMAEDQQIIIKMIY